MGGTGVTIIARMKVQLVDPSAFTPPYDHALCAALSSGDGSRICPLLGREFQAGLINQARRNGFDVDDELWAMDAADCSPCNDKVPDSH